MPSDQRTDAAARALIAPWESFHSAVAEAVEEVRSYLRAHRPHDAGEDAVGQAALGTFAAGRIDPSRFAALVAREAPTDVDTLSRMSRAFDSLSALAARSSGPLCVDVPAGGDLRGAIARELDAVGRAFGAARVAQLSRTGRYDDAVHRALLDGLPFRAWSAGERSLAPPLVVDVHGGDLCAGDLAAFLDGALKIVLVVRGASPPAPLVRLITPGTFVLQTSDPADLTGFAAAPGPGVAALLPEGAARFVHDPSGGAALADRLSIVQVPEGEPRTSLGGNSALQQIEDLRQLATLAAAVTRPADPDPVEAVAPAAAPVAAAEAPDPAGRLAAWLLQQAELPGTA